MRPFSDFLAGNLRVVVTTENQRDFLQLCADVGLRWANGEPALMCMPCKSFIGPGESSYIVYWPEENYLLCGSVESETFQNGMQAMAEEFLDCRLPDLDALGFESLFS